MDICKSFVSRQAAEDQTLQVFKSFYLGASASDRQKLYEYLCKLTTASTAVPVEQLPRETVKNRIIGVQVCCQLFGNGQVASINANALKDAMDAWDRGEEYAPEDPLD